MTLEQALAAGHLAEQHAMATKLLADLTVIGDDAYSDEYGIGCATDYSEAGSTDFGPGDVQVPVPMLIATVAFLRDLIAAELTDLGVET